jgi:ketosteroid isomerase-like protein
MADTPAARFAAALQDYESKGEQDALTALFAEGSSLERPEVSKAGSSSDDPAAYWKAYADQFEQVRTEFGHVHEDESGAWLEWTSSGTLTTGRDIEYAGVSLLELDDEGLVRRFATYYDTAAFLEPER